MSNYIYDNAGLQASQRFSSLETLHDPWTIRHLEATGIGPGWRCWEVGAGGGSIAVWLAERCGSNGQVLVTDIDPRFLVENATLNHPQITIQRHDITTDPMPDQTFDLIHARLVLIHLPTREQVLDRLAAALKPGGWLVLDEYDCTLIDQTYPTSDAAAAALFRKMRAAQNQLLMRHGADPAWGQKLYKSLQAHGLVNVCMDGTMAVCEGGSPGTRLMRANCEQVREEAVSAGLVADEEVEQMLALLDDPNFAISGLVMFTAWGCRPSPAIGAGASVA